MDIGTAKPSVEQQRLVKHHCLDIVYPNQSFTAADFVTAAKNAEKQIYRRGKKVITVGGSGLFIDAYVYDFSMVPPNRSKRQFYEQWDVAGLQAEIINKKMTLPINSKNKRHLIHTLEREGLPAPTRNPISASTIIVGISPAKNERLERITLRAQEMIDGGVVDEARQLYDEYGQQNAFRGGVYSVIGQYIGGNIEIDALEEAIIRSDMYLAKRQMTWFKRNKDIHWFDTAQDARVWLEDSLKGTL